MLQKLGYLITLGNGNENEASVHNLSFDIIKPIPNYSTRSV